MKDTKSKKLNIRKHKISKDFEQLLLEIGYSTSSIDKLWQKKFAPPLRKAFELEDTYGIPARALLNIREYLEKKIKEEEDPKAGEKPLNKAS